MPGRTPGREYRPWSSVKVCARTERFGPSNSTSAPTCGVPLASRTTPDTVAGPSAYAGSTSMVTSNASTGPILIRRLGTVIVTDFVVFRTGWRSHETTPLRTSSGPSVLLAVPQNRCFVSGRAALHGCSVLLHYSTVKFAD